MRSSIQLYVANMTPAFIRAQIEYYQRMWHRGNARDWQMIDGLLDEYQRRLRQLERLGRMTTVVHINNHDGYDVYIGRPSKWGNPFRLADYGNDRHLVVRMFEQWLRRPAQQSLIEAAVKELDGKRLGCYCRPAQCHGDIWVKLIEEWKVMHDKSKGE